MPAVPKPEVIKDPQYLAFVRTRPCILRGRMGHTCGDTMGNGLSEVSHLQGKSNDGCVLPMCGVAHRTGKDAWHRGMRSFCIRWNFYKDELIAQAEQLYRSYKEGV